MNPLDTGQNGLINVPVFLMRLDCSLDGHSLTFFRGNPIPLLVFVRIPAGIFFGFPRYFNFVTKASGCLPKKRIPVIRLEDVPGNYFGFPRGIEARAFIPKRTDESHS